MTCPQVEGFKFVLNAEGICVGTTDWISVITQTGRLDFVSALLGAIAILLVIAALPVYQLIQAKCVRIARDIGEKLRDDVLQKTEELTIQELQKRLPSIVQDYMDLAQNAATAEEGDQIAGLQEDVRNDR